MKSGAVSRKNIVLLTFAFLLIIFNAKFVPYPRMCKHIRVIRITDKPFTTNWVDKNPRALEMKHSTFRNATEALTEYNYNNLIQNSLNIDNRTISAEKLIIDHLDIESNNKTLVRKKHEIKDSFGSNFLTLFKLQKLYSPIIGLNSTKPGNALVKSNNKKSDYDKHLTRSNEIFLEVSSEKSLDRNDSRIRTNSGHKSNDIPIVPFDDDYTILNVDLNEVKYSSPKSKILPQFIPDQNLDIEYSPEDSYEKLINEFRNTDELRKSDIRVIRKPQMNVPYFMNFKANRRKRRNSLIKRYRRFNDEPLLKTDVKYNGDETNYEFGNDDSIRTADKILYFGHVIYFVITTLFSLTLVGAFGVLFHYFVRRTSNVGREEISRDDSALYESICRCREEGVLEL